MVGRLKQGIERGIELEKAFLSLEAEVHTSLQWTAAALQQGVAEVLRPTGLTAAHYDALRILRVAGSRGLGCREVAQRMIARDPDVTRLFDRLEARGLLTRTRAEADRRVVTVRITEEGRRALAVLDGPIEELHVKQLGHMGKERLRALRDLLEAIPLSA